MDGVSDAASLATLVQLATHIVRYLRTVIDAPVQKRKLLGALIQARGLLSTLVELANEVEGDDWSYTIQSLSTPDGPLSTFRELLEHMAKKLGIAPPTSKVATALRRLRWPFDQTSLQEMIDSLEKLKSHLLLAMANDHIRLSQAIRNELQQVQGQLAEASIRARRQAIVSLSKEEEVIVDSLSLRNLWYEMAPSKVMEMKAGAEWFLQHKTFKQWRSANSIPSTLVLTGRPGTGKSSICQVTRFFLKAWHRTEIDVCVAYFAFGFSQRSRGDGLGQSLVLSNIVQQILLERPYLMEHVAALEITGGPLSPAECINLLSRARRDLKQFYLILDGLDESERASRDVVNALLSIEPPLSILLAGRPSGVLSDIPKDSAMVCMDDAMALCHHLETIKKMFEKDSRIAGYLDHRPENIAEAAKLVVEKNGGLYVL
jgi:precorrin-6B methylase 1